MGLIEIQLTLDGEWIPLFGGATPHDSIGESRRILNAGLFGIRVAYVVNTEDDSYAWTAWRYSVDGKRFAWQSGSMAAPAFADL